MLIEFIGQEGAKTCEELAGKFGVSTSQGCSTLAVSGNRNGAARARKPEWQNPRHCMPPSDNLPAEPKARIGSGT
ncbi:DUF1627 domain-containing protein [Escherichia coli]|nr:DUF1627 domain-containing protein [Escherichia coli]